MKQLKLIKKGERAILEMNGLLDGFSDADLEDISAYYAGNATKVGQASADMVDKGFKLYYAGSLTKGIPACTACHSPRGLGNDPAAYPLLSGQQPAYIIKTLKEQNIGVLITDHNVHETLQITDRAYLLFEGNILKQGTAEELAADEQVRKVYLGKNFELRR